jgi:hypothetical protein
MVFRPFSWQSQCLHRMFHVYLCAWSDAALRCANALCSMHGVVEPYLRVPFYCVCPCLLTRWRDACRDCSTTNGLRDEEGGHVLMDHPFVPIRRHPLSLAVVCRLVRAYCCLARAVCLFCCLTVSTGVTQGVCCQLFAVMRHQKMRMHVKLTSTEESLDGMPFITSETSMCLIDQSCQGRRESAPRADAGWTRRNQVEGAHEGRGHLRRS